MSAGSTSLVSFIPEGILGRFFPCRRSAAPLPDEDGKLNAQKMKSTPIGEYERPLIPVKQIFICLNFIYNHLLFYILFFIYRITHVK